MDLSAQEPKSTTNPLDQLAAKAKTVQEMLEKLLAEVARLTSDTKQLADELKARTEKSSDLHG